MPAITGPNSSRSSKSLVAALAGAFVALSVIPILVVGSVLGYFGFRDQQTKLFYQQQLIAAGAAKEVSGFVEQLFSALEASAHVGQASDREQQGLILQKLLGVEPALRELVLMDNAGQKIAGASRRSSTVSSKLLELARGDMLAQVRQEQRFISEVYFDEETAEPLLVLAVPMKDVFGDAQGALVAEVNLKFMWDVVGQLQVGETGLAYVVDKHGNLIAFGDATRALKGENLSHLTEVAEFIRDANVDEPELYSTGINGSKVVATFVALGTPDWAVVTETPVEEAYAGVIWQALFSIGITLALAVLAGLLGIFVARRLTVPLVNLTGTATRIAGGQMELQAVVGGPREVASLAMAFNSMTAQLRQTMDGLEQRVAERTVDLQRALETVEAHAREQERLLAENRQQRETIRDMSVPVLPVTDSALVMPLVGALDSERLRLLNERALRAIERSRARTLILDITGVPIVDSQVAQGLIVVVQSARLLGAEVLLVGVSPEVAQAIVGLGLSLSEIRTYNDLQGALSRRSLHANHRSI